MSVCPTGCPAARQQVAELVDVLTRARAALETDSGTTTPERAQLVDDLDTQLDRLAGRSSA